MPNGRVDISRGNMAKKLSNLFFSTVKKMARLQRQAFRLASAPPVKRHKKKVVKKAAVHYIKAAPAVPAYSGAGSWQNLIHKTPPSSTELLGRLAYGLYKPASGSIEGRPLVVMLHGCQQTAWEMAMGSRMNRLADSKGFVVLYPQQTRRVQALRCWRWFQPDAAHGFAEADAIADLARTIVARHKLDAGRVYVAGLSAGAGMAGLTALRHPRLFAAVGMHSGAVLGEAHSSTEGMRVMRHGTLQDPASLIAPLVENRDRFLGIPAIVLHGQRDHLVAPRNARQLAQQFVHVNWALSVGGDPVSAQALGKVGILAVGTQREYHREDFLLGGKVMVRLCLIKDIGHAWSGGDEKLKFNAKEGPNASLLIWQFFVRHCRAAG